MAISVASVKITKAGSEFAWAIRRRQARRASNTASSYPAGQFPQRPSLRSVALVSRVPQTRHFGGPAGVRALGRPWAEAAAARSRRAQPVQEARGPAVGPAPGRAGQRPGQAQVHAGAGDAHVEQPSFLVVSGLVVGEGDRHQPLGEPDQEHRVPFQALGRVQRGQRDALDAWGRAGWRRVPPARPRSLQA